jgi:hypothetical protein
MNMAQPTTSALREFIIYERKENKNEKDNSAFSAAAGDGGQQAQIRGIWIEDFDVLTVASGHYVVGDPEFRAKEAL